MRILIVEDDSQLRALAKIVLRAHDVSVAGSAQEAFALLQDNHFDLLITDFHIPGLNGRQLIEQVRAARPSMRSVLMSDGLDAAHQAWLHSEGVLFVQKPYSPAKLLRLVESLRKPVHASTAIECFLENQQEKDTQMEGHGIGLSPDNRTADPNGIGLLPNSEPGHESAIMQL